MSITTVTSGQDALSPHMQRAAAGDPQFIHDEMLGVFVLSAWKDHADLLRAAGREVPEHTMGGVPSDPEWDLDRELEEGCSGVTFGPHPDAHYEE